MGLNQAKHKQKRWKKNKQLKIDEGCCRSEIFILKVSINILLLYLIMLLEE